jgi:tRNA threonylcarbamoyladenosine modification (KEOPS) complex  Pcc1 subunit
MKALVSVSTASKREAEIISRSLAVSEKPGNRSSLSVSSAGENLELKAEASDLGALRAILNSSLRELKIADEALL